MAKEDPQNLEDEELLRLASEYEAFQRLECESPDGDTMERLLQSTLQVYEAGKARSSTQTDEEHETPDSGTNSLNIAAPSGPTTGSGFLRRVPRYFSYFAAASLLLCIAFWEQSSPEVAMVESPLPSALSQDHTALPQVPTPLDGNSKDDAPIVASLPEPSFPFSPPESQLSHSSTVLNDALGGSDVLIRTQDEKNLLDAQALASIEDARTRYLENRVEFVGDHFEIKEIQQNYRQFERQRALAKRSQEQQLEPQSDQEIAKSYQLSALELNPTTGAIAWPDGLSSPRFATYRHRISKLLDQMIQNNLAGDEFYRNELAKVCDQLSEQLRDDASETGTLRDARYYAAARFVVGLKYSPYNWKNSENKKQTRLNSE